MKTTYLEFVVGVFLALGVLCLAFLSVKVARKDFFTSEGYEVQAVFSNCSGLRRGSPVMIAGVQIGQVKQISLQDYEAKVKMVLQSNVAIQKDAIASIKTKGLIGEKYIEISPGAADEKVAPGGIIRDTEPALDMEGLISKFVHGNVSRPTEEATPAKP
jgi:phospholipid/cholesterol/gamma-HCH transport system substrate-binding protein